MVIDAIQSVFATAADLAPQVIVADNGSSDNSLQLIKQTFGKRVEIIALGKNTGFATANNAGILKSSGEYILFLNPDTLVLENALQILTQYMDTHPSVGACGGNLYDKEMKPQFSYWMLFPGWRMEWSGLFSDYFLRRKHHGSEEHNFSESPKKVAYIIGADLMVRRSVIEQVGAMDEEFFLFYEETDLCYRIHKAGYEIINVPQAKIIHLEGQTIDKMQIRRQQMMRSRAIYLRKHCLACECIVSNVLLALSSGVRTLWFALRGNEPKKRFWKYTLQHIYHP